MARVLVTGANGFIGSHIVEKLIYEGHEVIGFVRKSSDLKLINNLPLKLVFGDVTELHSLKNAFEKIEVVVHNAGLASDWGQYKIFERVNVVGTQNVAQAAFENNVKRIVYVSSTAIHGFGSKYRMDENSPINHHHFPYARSKQVAEDLLYHFAKQHPIEITVIRPGNVFGPRDHTFMQKYLDAILAGKAAVINGGKAMTCPTYVENLADAIALVCIHPNASGESFIITDGLDIDWNRFNTKILNALHYYNTLPSYPFKLAYAFGFVLECMYKLVKAKNAPLITRYRVQNGGLDYIFSIEKAKALLGFTPKIGLEDALSKTIEWYLTTKQF